MSELKVPPEWGEPISDEIKHGGSHVCPDCCSTGKSKIGFTTHAHPDGVVVVHTLSFFNATIAVASFGSIRA